MAQRGNGFNLSEVIRQFRKTHRSVSANDALSAVKKAHPGQKINDGTFRATFYKLVGNRKRKKSVIRRRPGRVAMGGGDVAMRAGLAFIRLAGGVQNAQAQLNSLNELIETAQTLD